MQLQYKYFGFYVVVLIILMIVYSDRYVSLEKNLAKRCSKSEVNIHFSDYENKLILYSESYKGSGQYVLTTFKHWWKFYRVDNKYGGMTVNSPFFITVSNREPIGNVIWGVINEKYISDMKRISIEFDNKNQSISYEFSCILEDNTFVFYPDYQYKRTDFSGGKWGYHIKVYDEHQNLVFEEKESYIPYLV